MAARTRAVNSKNKWCLFIEIPPHYVLPPNASTLGRRNWHRQHGGQTKEPVSAGKHKPAPGPDALGNASRLDVTSLSRHIVICVGNARHALREIRLAVRTGGRLSKRLTSRPGCFNLLVLRCSCFSRTSEDLDKNPHWHGKCFDSGRRRRRVQIFSKLEGMVR